METARRNKWIGILIGACFITAGPFIDYFMIYDSFYTVLFFLAGGFIAGIFSSGSVIDGIKSGFRSGVIGSAVLDAIFAWVLISALIGSLWSGTVDEMAGWAIPIGLILTAAAIILASVGAESDSGEKAVSKIEDISIHVRSVPVPGEYE